MVKFEEMFKDQELEYVRRERPGSFTGYAVLNLVCTRQGNTYEFHFLFIMLCLLFCFVHVEVCMDLIACWTITYSFLWLQLGLWGSRHELYEASVVGLSRSGTRLILAAALSSFLI